MLAFVCFGKRDEVDFFRINKLYRRCLIFKNNDLSIRK